MTYQRILLPLDGSSLAEQAIPYAATHARQFQAELILLRVLEPLAERRALSQAAIRKAEELTRAMAQEYLEGLAAGIREQGLQVQAVTIEGRPHAEIVRFAEENQIDLIVICTRGQSGFSRWLMGSVVDRVVRGASVPVLLVRAVGSKSRPDEKS